MNLKKIWYTTLLSTAVIIAWANLFSEKVTKEREEMKVKVET